MESFSVTKNTNSTTFTAKLFINLLTLNYLRMEKEIANALFKCDLFKEMTIADIEYALSGIKHKNVTLQKNDILYLSGDPCRYADIVINGELTVRMCGLSGRQVEILRIRPGELIAPCFMFASDNKIPVDIEACERTSILRTPSECVKRLIDENRIIRKNMIKILSDISSYLVTKMGILSLMTVREKVACFLRSEAIEQKCLTIRLDKSRQHIADSFAIQKYSLLRCLAELSKDRIIEVNGKEIKILDLKRLR